MASEAPDDDRLEWVVPLPRPRAAISEVTHFRSTWLTASQATIREHGHGAKYEQNLDPRHKASVLASVPGLWMPIDAAYAHYEACDRLDLPNDELVAIGMAATRRANVTSLQFVTRLAHGAGVTPWTVLAQGPRFWERSFQGGAMAVARLGPKEARIEVLGYPLAALRYNRLTMRGIARAFVELFCKACYVNEIPNLTSARRVGMRVSWV